MKKYMVLFLAFVVLMGSGCANLRSFPKQKPQAPRPPKISNIEKIVYDGHNDKSRKNDMEQDINAIDIQDDLNLTKRVLKDGNAEIELLVSQDKIKRDGENLKKGRIILLNSAEGSSPQKVIVLQGYYTDLPAGIEKNIRYNNYPLAYDYLLITGSNINIREAPGTESTILRKTKIFEKLNVMQKVRGENISQFNSDVWYRVFWNEGGKIKYGYIFGYSAAPRSFQFAKMAKAITSLKNEVENNRTGFVSNYKNRNGMPPAYNGKEVDQYGNERGQSAPGYSLPNTRSEFRYFPDGTIVTILGENGNFYRVRTLSFPGEYWIPKRYISFRNAIKNLMKVVVVDRKNQNEAVFEYSGGKWKMISYTLATTGLKGEFAFETPMGYFTVIEKKERLYYLDFATGKLGGYGPYATRFSGGAYIHGVPVDFKYVDGEPVDPGMQEYLYTIGTTPRSHKCVRNYTSHAKFIYDWVEIGKTAVIVIE